MVLVHQRTQALFQHMGVYLRCRYIGMAQKLLHRSQIRAAFEQMAGEGMAQHMRRDAARIETGGEGETHTAEMRDQYERFSEHSDAAEKVFIERKLDEFNWNVSKTAEAIGIQRSHLYNKLSKYSIEREEAV